MKWMLRNSRGRPDALLTFSAGAVAIVFAKTLLHGVVAFGVTFGSIDPGMVAALLTPTLGAYVAKRIGADREPASTVLPPTASTTGPPRGMVDLLELGFLLLIGVGCYLVARAHLGRP